MIARRNNGTCLTMSNVTKRRMLLVCACLVLAAFTVYVYAAETDNGSDAADDATYIVNH